MARPSITLSSRARALLLLAALLIVAALLLILPALESRAALDRELAGQRTMKLRLQSLASRAAQGTPATAADPARGSVVIARGAPLAAAGLQTRVDEILTTSGARTEQLQAEAVTGEQQGPVLPLRVSATFGATTAQLQRILFAVESGTPAMAIERLSIQTLPVGPDQPKDTLRVEMTARALAMIEP